MDIQDLQYFLTVCDYRSITKAAEVLHISQPALSRRIQFLEEECGVKLFIRGWRFVELTPAGEHFSINAHKIVESQIKALQEIEFYKHDVDIRFGFVADINMKGVLRIQSISRRLIPDASLAFFDILAKEMPSALLAGNIDVAYVMEGEVSDITGLKFVKIESNNLSVLVPAGHKLWHRNFVTCDDLVGETLFIACSDREFCATTSKVIDFINRRIPDANIHFKGSTCKLLVDICAGAGIGLNGVYSVDNSIGSNEYYKNIIISDACVPYGDLVLAYKADNREAEAYVQKLSAIMKA
jgi:DNA-binding transcriptional LysR family regulator